MKKQAMKVGDLIAFQIGEFSEDFSAPNKDHWGVLKILDLGTENDGSFVVSVKSGLWQNKPTLWQAWTSRVLVEKRFKILGTNSLEPEPVIFTTAFDCEMNLLNADVIGKEIWNRKSEREARREIREFGGYFRIAAFDFAPLSLDHEYRAEFDQERWIAETEAYSEKQFRLRQEREEREKLRLKALTIKTLLDEIQFQDWDQRTQIVPSEFTTSVRTRSKELLNELNALGVKPKRKEVRQLLRSYISWLNSIDGTFGYEIETEEREDLMVFVEEVCWATKQKPLIEEVDEWRDW